MTVQIIESARRILAGSGYTTRSSSAKDQILFEDATIFGFIQEMPKVADLLIHWQKVQDLFVRDNTLRLSRIPSKALNLYAVFLTAGSCTVAQQQELFEVEEDFRSARKIARAGVGSKLAIEAALSPILPLHQVGSLLPFNLKERLQEDRSVPGWLEASLASDESAADIVKELLARHEDLAD